jgi:hypothetical protein
VPYQLASSRYAISRARREDSAPAWRLPGTGQVRMGEVLDESTKAPGE